MPKTAEEAPSIENLLRDAVSAGVDGIFKAAESVEDFEENAPKVHNDLVSAFRVAAMKTCKIDFSKDFGVSKPVPAYAMFVKQWSADHPDEKNHMVQAGAAWGKLNSREKEHLFLENFQQLKKYVKKIKKLQGDAPSAQIAKLTKKVEKMEEWVESGELLADFALKSTSEKGASSQESQESGDGKKRKSRSSEEKKSAKKAKKKKKDKK